MEVTVDETGARDPDIGSFRPETVRQCKISLLHIRMRDEEVSRQLVGQTQMMSG